MYRAKNVCAQCELCSLQEQKCGGCRALCPALFLVAYVPYSLDGHGELNARVRSFWESYFACTDEHLYLYVSRMCALRGTTTVVLSVKSVVVMCVRSAFGLAARGCVFNPSSSQRVSPHTNISVEVGVLCLGPTRYPPTVDHDTPMATHASTMPQQRSAYRSSGMSSGDCRTNQARQTAQSQCCLPRCGI